MILVDRASVRAPVFDTPHKTTKLTELDRARAHINAPGPKKAFKFSVYKSDSAKSALEKLFHGKCAYCESFFASTQPVDVEHYRPKGEVEGEAGHPGYWWLAMIWSNLLPSCIDCNRRREQVTPDASAPSLVRLVEQGDRNRWRKLSTGKASAFPLSAGSVRASGEHDPLDVETPLLLDPTREDPAKHLGFYVDREHLVSLVYPRSLTDADDDPVLPPHETALGLVEAEAARVSAKGAVSIQVYGLNRLSLVQARTRLLLELEFLLELSISIDAMAVETADRLSEKRTACALHPAGEIEDDIAFLERIAHGLAAHGELVRSRLRASLSPRAPYSALARAWAQAFIEHG